MCLQRHLLAETRSPSAPAPNAVQVTQSTFKDFVLLYFVFPDFNETGWCEWGFNCTPQPPLGQGQAEPCARSAALLGPSVGLCSHAPWLLLSPAGAHEQLWGSWSYGADPEPSPSPPAAMAAAGRGAPLLPALLSAAPSPPPPTLHYLSRPHQQHLLRATQTLRPLRNALCQTQPFPSKSAINSALIRSHC